MTKILQLPATALVLSTLVVAGCSSAPPSTTGASGSRVSTLHAQAVRFAECMRNSGVSGFPDPDANGSLTLDGVVNGSSLQPDSPSFKSALQACKTLEPPGFTGQPRTAAQQSAALKFAQCIRDKGVTDFPDPVQGEPLVDTNRISSAATPQGMSILNAAMHKCRQASAAAGVTGGK
jgi:hypothetical protein